MFGAHKNPVKIGGGSRKTGAVILALQMCSAASINITLEVMIEDVDEGEK